jgi:hypothetical protein
MLNKTLAGSPKTLDNNRHTLAVEYGGKGKTCACPPGQKLTSETKTADARQGASGSPASRSA